MDNATRWNSVYRMLTRALNVRERLTKFVREHKPQNTAGGDPHSERYRPQNERLTAKDWIFLERLYSALEAFYAATMVTQGYEPWLSDWFTTLHWLLNEVNDWKVDALEEQGDEHLAACLGASWNKIEKHYKLVDNMHVYYAAILLNPTLKTAKLRQMWSSNPDTAPWVSQVEEYVKTMWRTQYKPANRASTACTTRTLLLAGYRVLNASEQTPPPIQLTPLRHIYRSIRSHSKRTTLARALT